MSAPSNNLRTPQIFHAPIPRSPAMTLYTLTDADGNEWIESMEFHSNEAKLADEDILQAQIAYDEKIAKEKEKAMIEGYRAKLFRNVLGTPQGKK